MRKLFFSFLVLTTIYTSSSAWSLPDWVLPELNKYPIETFLFNVGQSDETGKESFERAMAKAHRRVATEILKKVAHIIRSNKDESQHDMVREHYSAVLEDYCAARQELPALQLKGLSVRNLSVDLARTDSYTYALVYVDRKKLKDLYTKRIVELRGEIKRRLEYAKVAEKNLDIKGAVEQYLRTYPLYEALKEAEIIRIGAEYAPRYSNAFSQLANAATYTSNDLWTHRQVIKRVQELNPQIIVSLDDIASAIEFQLLRQYGTPSSKVLIEPLTYEDSEMLCPFAQDFSLALQMHLGWTTVDAMHKFDPTSPDISNTNQNKPPQRLTCSCWKNGDEITIRTTVRNTNTGEFLASAVVQFWNSQLRSAIVCSPPNYERILPEKDVFTPRYYTISHTDGSNNSTSEELEEHLLSPVGGLEVKIWTNKGRDPLYYEGETMKVFGSVNQPAYLRLLYILADDRKYTLLKDNYYINPSQINSDVEIGEFVCTPPFGGEVLVVAARTEKFPPIQTYEENGYLFLIDQDPESAARSFQGLDDGRGMKRIPDKLNEQQPIDPPENNEQEPPIFQQSEAQLVLTTMEK